MKPPNLEDIRTALAAASSTTDDEVRRLYLASARVALTQLETDTSGARLLLEAAEREEARRAGHG